MGGASLELSQPHHQWTTKVICYDRCFLKKKKKKNWSTAFSRAPLFAEQWGCFFFIEIPSCYWRGAALCKHGGARAPTMTDQWSRQVENSPLGFWLSWGIVPTHALVSEPPKRRKEDCVEPAGLHARYSKADTLGWYRAAEDSVRIKKKKPHHLQSHDSHFYTHHERIHSHLSVFTFIHFLQEWEKLHTHTHTPKTVVFSCLWMS